MMPAAPAVRRLRCDGDSGVLTLGCTACGAVIEIESMTVATACSYCTSKLVDVERAAAVVDAVAPFRMPKRAAADRMAQHLAGRWWAPQALRARARAGHIHPDLHGVLVPCRVYEARCRSRWSADIGVHWHETVTEHDKGERRERVVHHTEWFPLQGTSALRLHDHVVSASRGLTEAEVIGLAPFDIGRAVRFDPRLLAGFAAEVPSRIDAEVERDAVRSIREIVARRVESEVLTGDTHRRVRVDTVVELEQARLLLLPVWVATWRYAGKVQRMLVNGQTGRCMGAVPISPFKIALAAATFAALALLMLWLGGRWPWPR
jgi:DNA-directed RNA polymerase subunit RPC12/RpoP